MAAPRHWVRLDLPGYCSAWLLSANRRPLPFLLTLVVGPLLVILAVTHGVNVRLARRQALHRLTMTARLAALIVEETLGETWLLERATAASPEFHDALRARHAARLSELVRHAFTVTSRVDVALVLAPDGTILATVPARPEVIGASAVEDEGFRSARAAGWQPVVSAVHLRGGGGVEKVVDVVWPIRQDEGVLGVLQFQHRVEEIKSWLARIRVEPEGFLYLVDHRQQLVVYPFQVLPGRPKQVADWPPVTAPLTEAGATLMFREARRGQRWLAGVWPVGELGWRMVAVQPERAAFTLLRRILWPMGVLVGVLLVLIIAISLRWAQLQEFNLRLLRQNAKLLKQQQQRALLDRGRADKPKGPEAP